MDKFLEKIADILEVDIVELNENTDYRTDVPYWDSMLGFATLVMIEDDFGKSISVDDFLETKTLGDLWKKISE